MEGLEILALILVLVFLIGLYRSRSKVAPWCPPPPPAHLLADLGDEETTPLGVPGDMVRAIYSVVDPPLCTTRPDMPQAKSVPDTRDVRHIITQATRRMRSKGSTYEFHPGHVVYSVLYTDSRGMGTYYITCMIHEKTTSITARIAMKASMLVGSDDPPRILNISFDPQHADPDSDEPCRAGNVPPHEAEQLDTSIYRV